MARLRCKVGDIAMITPVGETAKFADDLTGRLVRVVRATLPGETYEDSRGSWFVESLGSLIRQDIVHPATGEFMRHQPSQTRNVADRHLTPIRKRRGVDETLRARQLQRQA